MLFVIILAFYLKRLYFFKHTEHKMLSIVNKVIIFMLRYIRTSFQFSMPKARLNQIFKRSSQQIYNVTLFWSHLKFFWAWHKCESSLSSFDNTLFKSLSIFYFASESKQVNMVENKPNGLVKKIATVVVFHIVLPLVDVFTDLHLIIRLYSVKQYNFASLLLGEWESEP